jgi:putative tryptophan/tyrosine transport system substrate-binding protein
MRRRDFIRAVGTGAVAWTTAERARGQGKIWQIGFLGLAPSSAWVSQIDALRDGLRDLGYVEGKNINIEYRWADKVDQFGKLADEFVRLNVNVIIAPASTQVGPARAATSTIPIVFTQHADPVGLGHVASLARPGGNITGVSMVLTQIAVKGLDILGQTLNRPAKIGIMWNPDTPSHPLIVKALEAAAVTLDLQLLLAPATSIESFSTSFEKMIRERVSGVLVPSSPLTNSQPALLAELSLKAALPSMFANKANVVAGGFMSYGADFNYMYRLSARYIDQIFKGAKPADLPVEQASRYQLIINLKTAKKLNISIPTLVLARADELIEE